MDEQQQMHEALAAAAQHTPYGEVLLATKYELDLIHEQLAEILTEIKQLGHANDKALERQPLKMGATHRSPESKDRGKR